MRRDAATRRDGTRFVSSRCAQKERGQRSAARRVRHMTRRVRLVSSARSRTRYYYCAALHFMQCNHLKLLLSIALCVRPEVEGSSEARGPGTALHYINGACHMCNARNACSRVECASNSGVRITESTVLSTVQYVSTTCFLSAASSVQRTRMHTATAEAHSMSTVGLWPRRDCAF